MVIIFYLYLIKVWAGLPVQCAGTEDGDVLDRCDRHQVPGHLPFLWQWVPIPHLHKLGGPATSRWCYNLWFKWICVCQSLHPDCVHCSFSFVMLLYVHYTCTKSMIVFYRWCISLCGHELGISGWSLVWHHVQHDLRSCVWKAEAGLH